MIAWRALRILCVLWNSGTTVLCTSGLSSNWRSSHRGKLIRLFCKKAVVAKRDNVIEYELLEACVREVLNKTTDRVMAVLNPVKLVITNYPDGQTEMMTAVNNPEDENSATRELPFS